jgi:hypothetical protein
MRLKFNRNSELFFPDFGLYKPGQVVKVDNEMTMKNMLRTGCFDEIKEKEKIIKKRKSKRKGVDLNVARK